MKAFVKISVLLFSLISFSSCSKVETGSQTTTDYPEAAPDTIPTIEPELPETANVVEPIITDSMPVAEPENINKQ